MAVGIPTGPRVSPRRCPICATPRELHARCWRPGCPTLYGPGHAEPRPDPARLGLCLACAASFQRWSRGAAAPIAVEVADDAAGGQLLTPAEVGARIRRSPKTVRRLIKSHRLPAVLAPRNGPGDDPRGGRYLVRAVDVENLRG